MVQAIDIIDGMARVGRGGYVVTPNVDHVALAQKNCAFRDAYRDATLSLVDGMPLVWLSRLIGFPVPEKVSGSDLIRPLMRRAARTNKRVYLLGAAPGVAAEAAKVLIRENPSLRIVGIDSPPLGFDLEKAQEEAALNKMLAAEPELVLLALGAPKQELLMHRWYKRGVKQVMVGIGAGLDFIAGRAKRAPHWMSNAGLEWLYRLYREPRRLAGRYLVRDLAIIRIGYRMLMLPRSERIWVKSEDHTVARLPAEPEEATR